MVNKAIIERRVDEELPFMATENIIMALVEKGKSRQEAHEEIRYAIPSPPSPSPILTYFLHSVLSHQAGAVVKQEGKPNDLIERIRKNAYFEDIIPELDSLLNPSTFIGRCPEIVEKLVVAKVKPALEKYSEALATAEVAELSV